ncbi:MAG: GerMN domain-containing protein [Spirochaetales bacterium]|nr:GerMN domain-containing protein [Spirochaetales bacterium]
MEIKFKHYLLIFSGIIVFLFTLSLIFYLVNRAGYVRRILFFPEKFTNKLIGEERYLNKKESTEEDIQNLLEELVYGPMNKQSTLLFPYKTRLVSLLFKEEEEVLYLNFSRDILFLDKEFPLSYVDIFQSVINTLKFNFPGLKDIIFFINGQVPVFNRGEESGQKLEMRYVEDMVK